MSTVYRFSCGHTGRTAERHAGFLRVAELRNAPLQVVHTPCPGCKGGSVSAGQRPVESFRSDFALGANK